MTTYIYCADLHCEDCARGIMADLDTAGKRPENWMDDSSFDSDDYPKGTASEGGGESDIPQHCGFCGAPLENELTSDGVNYVLEAIRESISEAIEKGRATAWDRIMPMPGTGEESESHSYWKGSRHVEIVRGWAEQVRNYNLEREESAIVNLFLELSSNP